MNKHEIAEALAYKTHLPKADAMRAVDAFIAVVSKALSNGNDVRIVGFGTFTVIDRKACAGRNPRNGSVIQIPAMTRPKFKGGMALTKAVNKGYKKK
jgi:DNA-binding protein HU-beta